MWSILEILFSSQNPNFYLQYICNLQQPTHEQVSKRKILFVKVKKGKSKNVFVFKLKNYFIPNNKKNLMSEKKYAIPKNTIFREGIHLRLHWDWLHCITLTQAMHDCNAEYVLSHVTWIMSDFILRYLIKAERR